jgi:hypothetical protein
MHMGLLQQSLLAACVYVYIEGLDALASGPRRKMENACKILRNFSLIPNLVYFEKNFAKFWPGPGGGRRERGKKKREEGGRERRERKRRGTDQPSSIRHESRELCSRMGESGDTLQAAAKRLAPL